MFWFCISVRSGNITLNCVSALDSTVELQVWFQNSDPLHLCIPQVKCRCREMRRAGLLSSGAGGFDTDRQHLLQHGSKGRGSPAMGRLWTLRHDEQLGLTYAQPHCISPIRHCCVLRLSALMDLYIHPIYIS